MNGFPKIIVVKLSVLLAGMLLFAVGVSAQTSDGVGFGAGPGTLPGGMGFGTGSGAQAADESARRIAFERIADEGFTQGNFDLLDEYLAEDYVVHSPFGDLNREDVKSFFAAMRAAFTDFLVVRENMVIEGDYAAMRTIVTGTFEHEFSSASGVISPNGQPIALEIVMIFHFDDEGMVDEEWAQFDNLGFLTQLGALPAPAS